MSRTMRARTYLLAAALAAVAAVVGGCGVPTQGQATAVTVENLGRPGSGTPSETTAGATTLWFVQDNRLVAVRAGSSAVTSGELLDLLASGPPQGAPNSMRSLVADPAHGGALLGIPADQAARPPSGQVTVAVTDAFGSLPADEQVLLLGQVVITLGHAGASSVLLTDPDGVPLAMPLPDGRLLDGPARAADYSSLIA